MDLFDPKGYRLYLTGEERTAFPQAAGQAEREVRTFCLVMLYTGCRISDALAPTARSFDFSGKAIIFRDAEETPARIFRAVPIPEGALDLLDMANLIACERFCLLEIRNFIYFFMH